MSGIKTKPFSFIFIFWSLSIFSCDKSTHDIHLESFVADTHNDVLLRAMEGQNILEYHPESHSDLEKFKLGGVDLQVFSIWVSPDEKEKKYFENANNMINKLNFLISRVPKDWGLAKSYQDITYNSRKNKMSCVIGVEGGHIIGKDISKLESLHDRGMRYLGLTWNLSLIHI